MADAQIGITIPQQLIEDTIRAQMVRQLGNTTTLIESVVAASMSEKEDRYSQQTKFQAAVNKMIQDEAGKIFKEWLDENRDALRIALHKYLCDKKQAVLKQICDAFASNCSQFSPFVSVSIAERSR